jgi:hypothetical protein
MEEGKQEINKEQQESSSKEKEKCFEQALINPTVNNFEQPSLIAL